ncbi:MAG: hypothetical protein WBV67_03605 [Candidatus Cybelea sp.]
MPTRVTVIELELLAPRLLRLENAASSRFNLLDDTSFAVGENKLVPRAFERLRETGLLRAGRRFFGAEIAQVPVERPKVAHGPRSHSIKKRGNASLACNRKPPPFAGAAL